MFEIAIADDQTTTAPWHERLQTAVAAILTDAGVEEAEVSLAIVDDDAIHELNRRLNHDCPTDVLSFLLERAGGRLEGEIIVSRDTAARMAPNYGWRAEDELLLYVIHGALHLVGFDDGTESEEVEMRKQEAQYLDKFGLSQRKQAANPGGSADV